jgi:hypothetical protein
LQALDAPPEFADQKLAVKEKGTVENDSASCNPRVSMHARLAAVAYEKESARIHGLDGSHRCHSL